MPYFILPVLAYLIGSMPFALWYGLYFRQINIREHGSGNIGATNVFRILGKRDGWIVLILDFLKALIPVYCASFISIPQNIDQMGYQILVGLLVVIGHILPIWAKFKGGKGVACMAGMACGLFWPSFLWCLAIFIIILLLSHFVSLSSVLSVNSYWIINYFAYDLGNLYLTAFGLFAAFLVIITHQSNIRRLMKGQEKAIYFKIP